MNQSVLFCKGYSPLFRLRSARGVVANIWHVSFQLHTFVVWPIRVCTNNKRNMYLHLRREGVCRESVKNNNQHSTAQLFIVQFFSAPPRMIFHHLDYLGYFGYLYLDLVTFGRNTLGYFGLPLATFGLDPGRGPGNLLDHHWMRPSCATGSSLNRVGQHFRLWPKII